MSAVRRKGGRFAWIALLCAAGQATAAPAPPLPTAQEQATIRRAIERGVLLYSYDQAAWHGTDAFLAKAGERKVEAGGYIVTGPPDATQLTFFDHDRAMPHALFVARFRDGGIVEDHLAPPGASIALDPVNARLAAALVTAGEAMARAGIRPCTPAPFNTIVVPPADAGASTTVYFLSPQTETRTLPMGGHYAVAVDPSGKAGPIRTFTKACLNMTPPAAKGQPAALFVTHLLDPMPTELHVFEMLAARQPLVVATSAGLWTVTSRDEHVSIALLRRAAPAR